MSFTLEEFMLACVETRWRPAQGVPLTREGCDPEGLGHWFGHDGAIHYRAAFYGSVHDLIVEMEHNYTLGDNRVVDHGDERSDNLDMSNQIVAVHMYRDETKIASGYSPEGIRHLLTYRQDPT